MKDIKLDQNQNLLFSRKAFACTEAEQQAFPLWSILVMHISHFLLGKKLTQLIDVYPIKNCNNNLISYFLQLSILRSTSSSTAFSVPNLEKKENIFYYSLLLSANLRELEETFKIFLFAIQDAGFLLSG